MAESGMGLYVVEGYYYTPPWGYFLSVVAFIGTMLGITDFGVRDSDLSFGMEMGSVFSDVVPTLEFAVLVKTSLVLVDILVAVLLYRLVSEQADERKATLARLSGSSVRW